MFSPLIAATCRGPAGRNTTLPLSFRDPDHGGPFSERSVRTDRIGGDRLRWRVGMIQGPAVGALFFADVFTAFISDKKFAVKILVVTGNQTGDGTFSATGWTDQRDKGAVF